MKHSQGGVKGPNIPDMGENIPHRPRGVSGVIRKPRDRHEQGQTKDSKSVGTYVYGSYTLPFHSKRHLN